MPQYKVKVKDLETGEVMPVTVWSSGQRQANVEALKKAKELLKTDNLTLVL